MTMTALGLGLDEDEDKQADSPSARVAISAVARAMAFAETTSETLVDLMRLRPLPGSCPCLTRVAFQKGIASA